MTHQEKVAAAVRELSSRGISRHRVAPPAYRLLWRLGLKVPPPLFQPLWAILLVQAPILGVMWLGLAIVWRGDPWWKLLILGLVMSLLFGLIPAFDFRRTARRLNLPLWRDYRPDT